MMIGIEERPRRRNIIIILMIPRRVQRMEVRVVKLEVVVVVVVVIAVTIGLIVIVTIVVMVHHHVLIPTGAAMADHCHVAWKLLWHLRRAHVIGVVTASFSSSSSSFSSIFATHSSSSFGFRTCFYFLEKLETNMPTHTKQQQQKKRYPIFWCSSSHVEIRVRRSVFIFQPESLRKLAS